MIHVPAISIGAVVWERSWLVLGESVGVVSVVILSACSKRSLSGSWVIRVIRLVAKPYCECPVPVIDVVGRSGVDLWTLVLESSSGSRSWVVTVMLVTGSSSVPKNQTYEGFDLSTSGPV